MGEEYTPTKNLRIAGRKAILKRWLPVADLRLGRELSEN